jgi:phosphate transport system permease protein
MPVQIFMWADFPEVLFRQKTSAAILVLLAFLITMNALAVILRKRFERRW